MRLAEYVFAPHYAAPLASVLIGEAVLRETRIVDSPLMATLSKGDAFELLDVTGGVAWGVATAHGLVGYVDAAALGIAD